MKKFLIAVCLIVVMVASTVMPAFAYDTTVYSANDVPATLNDNGFSNHKWNENNGKVSMFRFGHVQLNYGESIYDANNAGKCATDEKFKYGDIEDMLESGVTFYTYLKVQVHNSYYLNAVATVVLTDPNGNQFAVQDTKDLSTGKGWRTTKWFVPMNEVLEACSAYYGDTANIPSGSYQVSLFINDDPAAKTSFTISEEEIELSTASEATWQLED